MEYCQRYWKGCLFFSPLGLRKQRPSKSLDMSSSEKPHRFLFSIFCCVTSHCIISVLQPFQFKPNLRWQDHVCLILWMYPLDISVLHWKGDLEMEIQNSRSAIEVPSASSLRTNFWLFPSFQSRGKNKICRQVEPSSFRAMNCDWYWKKQPVWTEETWYCVFFFALYLPDEILCQDDNLGPHHCSVNLKPKHNRWQMVVFWL